MSDQEPRADQKPGPPPEPDLSFTHDGSTVEIYSLADILRQQSSLIYERSDFKQPIQKVTLDQEKLSLGGGVGLALTLTVQLDPLRNRSSYDPIIGGSGSLGRLSFDVGPDFDVELIARPDASGGTYSDMRYIVTEGGTRLVVWYSPRENFIRLGNNMHMVAGDEAHTPIVNVDPQPLETIDEEKLLEDFSRVGVSLLDSLSGYQLNRTYRIGERITDVPGTLKRTIGKAATSGAKAPSTPGEPETDQPLVKFEDLFSSGDEKVRLSDIGGLEDIKQELHDIALSFSNPEIMEKWGARRPQGILLYGEPGTGKTMLVEAFANEIGADLFRIQSSDIYVRWLGDSEAKIKELFEAFRKIKKPTVVLFDEFDAIVGITEQPSPGGADNARNSVAGIFKQEMNTLARENPNVLIVATTNHQDRIDSSLIRSGRFDHRLYVPMPDDEARDQIISTAISKLMLSREDGDFKIFADDLNTSELVSITDGLSGADISEIFRRISIKKAMAEARAGQVAPISQAELLEEIQDFKVESF